MKYKSGRELMEIANTFTEGDAMNPSNALTWINEFLSSKLGADAKIKVEKEYLRVGSDGLYKLPEDFAETYKVRRKGSRRRIFDYELDGNTICFRAEGDLILEYFSLPKEIPTIHSYVEIDPVFYHPLTLWLAYRFLSYDDEDQVVPNSLGNTRMVEYNIALTESKKQRAKKFRAKTRIRRT